MVDTYQRDGRWYLWTPGGVRNQDILEEEEIGPFPARPEPVARWQEALPTYQGRKTAVFTLLNVAGEPVALVRQVSFSNDPGYSWEERHEIFVALREPPALGESFHWKDGAGWVPAPHPQRVGETATAPSPTA